MGALKLAETAAATPHPRSVRLPQEGRLKNRAMALQAYDRLAAHAGSVTEGTEIGAGDYTRPRAPMVMTIGDGPSDDSSLNIFGQEVAQDSPKIFVPGERQKAPAIGEHTNKATE